MTFDIIQTEYFENLKGFSPYYKLITGVGFTIMSLDLLGVPILPKNRTITIILISIVLISVILNMLNSSLFTRIGQISFDDEKVVFLKNDIRSEFLLSDIKNIEISKTTGDQYSMEVNPLFEEIIEMKGNELDQFKKILTDHQIPYRRRSFLNWFKNLSFIKNNQKIHY
ncbi:hypothetical protein [uncultured Dokdonia sp.]|uniref:hypothetical protein n=1 Tax=uncultured Dokdonia sp. TaxID=575653 RepID=UPI00261D3322|nr:hypothetical protein [uncultured Dokdonia sp.]